MNARAAPLNICISGPFVSSSVNKRNTNKRKTTINHNGKFGHENGSTYNSLHFFDLSCQHTGEINNPSQKWVNRMEDDPGNVSLSNYRTKGFIKHKEYGHIAVSLN